MGVVEKDLTDSRNSAYQDNLVRRRGVANGNEDAKLFSRREAAVNALIEQIAQVTSPASDNRTEAMKLTTIILALAVTLVTAPVLMPGAQETNGRCRDATALRQDSAKGENSAACLSCHDGMMALDIALADSTDDKESPLHNHPVRISYQTAYSRDPAGYISPSMLDQRVKLVNGEVQCVSCHAVSPQGRWMLARSNARSALCLSCHRK